MGRGEISQLRRYLMRHCDALPFGVAKVSITQNTANYTTRVVVEDPFGIVPYIRRNSHRYLAKRTANGVCTICQLNDRNSRQFWDGTTADISTGAMGDVFTKIDMPVYFRFPNGDNPDVAVCEITLRPTTGFDDIWWPNWMIGTFEAQVTSSKMYSRADKAVSNNYTRDYGNTYATNRGAGYSQIFWEAHNKMAWLYYAMYGNTNCQASIGYGDTKRDSTVAYKQTGQTASLGMIDTVGELGILNTEFQLGSTNQGNHMSINFWGLENWWGNYLEWIGDANVPTAGSANMTVWIPNPTTGLMSSACQTREIPIAPIMLQNSSTSWSSCFVERMLIGAHGDLVNAKATISGTSATSDTYWCDSQAHTNIGSSSTWAGNAPRVVRRSNYLAYAGGGVAYAQANSGLSFTDTNNGGRLAFSGQIVEAASVADFIAAQIV